MGRGGLGLLCLVSGGGIWYVGSIRSFWFMYIHTKVFRILRFYFFSRSGFSVISSSFLLLTRTPHDVHYLIDYIPNNIGRCQFLSFINYFLYYEDSSTNGHNPTPFFQAATRSSIDCLNLHPRLGKVLSHMSFFCKW